MSKSDKSFDQFVGRDGQTDSSLRMAHKTRNSHNIQTLIFVIRLICGLFSPVRETRRFSGRTLQKKEISFC